MVRRKSLLASVLLTGALLFGSEVHAALAGRVVALSGSLVDLKPDGRRIALSINSEVGEGDTLLTYDASHASIRFSDGSTVTLKPDSQFRIQEFGFQEDEPDKDRAVFQLVKGGLRAVTGLVGKRKDKSYGMLTPAAVIGIRGTDYDLLHCAGDECTGKKNSSGAPLAEGLHIEVLEGAISVSNQAGSIDIEAGQFGFVKDSGTPPSPLQSGYRDPANGRTGVECTAR